MCYDPAPRAGVMAQVVVSRSWLQILTPAVLVRKQVHLAHSSKLAHSTAATGNGGDQLVPCLAALNTSVNWLRAHMGSLPM